MRNTEKATYLSAHMEDYLEAIAFLKEEKGVARVKDIGRYLHVKNPSVTQALSVLKKEKLILQERYGYIDLTLKGKACARRIQRRHDTLIQFLTDVLHIEYSIAAKDACKIEHAISQKTFEKLTTFMESAGRLHNARGHRVKGKAKR